MKQLELNNRKVAVIGCGFVGATSAFGLMQSGLFSEMVLIDANTEKAEGEAMDISHGIPFARPMKIYAGGYDDIMDAVSAVRLGKAVIRNIKQNLFWAFCYNTIGIPIAAGLLFAFGGPLLSPMFAGAAMSLSSVSVLLNALRLKGFKPGKS